MHAHVHWQKKFDSQVDSNRGPSDVEWVKKIDSRADSNRGPSDATRNQVVGARDSDSTTSATGERRTAAKHKHNSTESTSSSPVRADRASGRASGKRCDAASRNQLPLRVNGVLQPEPSATAPNLRLLAFCTRRAREAGQALGCSVSAGLAAAGSDAASG